MLMPSPGDRGIQSDGSAPATGRSVEARTSGSEHGEPDLALVYEPKIEISPASLHFSREITVVIALPCVGGGERKRAQKITVMLVG